MLRLTKGSWEAKVCVEWGANLCALSENGRPILREPKDLQTLKDDKYLYGVPLLFPGNRTQGGRFSFRGREYQLPVNEPLHNNNLHGSMIEAPFEVLEQTESRLRVICRNRGEYYPFAFDMTVTDEIEDGWTRTIALTALEDMPYTMSFHTTFVEPHTFSVPLGQRFVWDEHYIPTGEMVDAQPFGKAISGYHRSLGHTALVGDYAYTVSDQFDLWVLYNGGGDKDFLCIEPQCGEVNGLNSDAHRELAAGETETFVMTIKRKCK